MNQLTHLDSQGQARMVDVGGKPETARSATATGRIRMSSQALTAVRDGSGPKGDVLAAARIAGIMAAKKAAELIPLCHPIPLTSVAVEITSSGQPGRIHVQATAETVGQTGVEMEALIAASTAALTLYDMAKSMDRGMTVSNLRLVEKSGGKSGTFRREP